MAYRIGFDVGGTFTDFVLQSPSGELLTARRLTTYPDPSEAGLAGLDGLGAQGGVPWRAVAQAGHGTTPASHLPNPPKTPHHRPSTTRPRLLCLPTPPL